MQQPQGGVQDVQQDALGHGPLWAGNVAAQLLLQACLRGLNVPGSKVLLDELFQHLRGRGEAVRQQRLRDILDDAVALRDQRTLEPRHSTNLVVRERHARGAFGTELSLVLLELGQDEFACVPDLVRKALGIVDHALGQRSVLTSDATGEERVPQRIRTTHLDGLQRVNYVALGLAHLLTVPVTHQAVQVDLREGRLAGQCDAHHDHARDPEEEDVVTSLKHGRRVEVLEVGVGLVWPAHGGEGPEARREPGVQDIRILLQLDIVAEVCPRLLLRVIHRRRDVVLAVGVRPVHGVVHRDPVAPPELPGDAPRLLLLQPAVPDLRVPLRLDLDLAAGDSIHGLLGHLLRLDEPLVREHRLNDLAAAL
mmetsp:Transcript_83519/g.215089  ORF Transcript_83519/g.215089 Transcript_83519/m.215089 type:complete len:366 (+) Transcript_83519:1325-2422(+)